MHALSCISAANVQHDPIWISRDCSYVAYNSCCAVVVVVTAHSRYLNVPVVERVISVVHERGHFDGTELAVMFICLRSNGHAILNDFTLQGKRI